MAFIGRGRGGKQLITQGLAEPSGLGGASVAVTGVEACFELGNARASITISMGHGASAHRYAQPIIHNAQVVVRGVSAKSHLGDVRIRVEENVSVSVTGTKINSYTHYVYVRAGAAAQAIGNAASLSQGKVAVKISTSVPVCGQGLDLSLNYVKIHSVDRRLLEDQELLELLLAA